MVALPVMPSKNTIVVEGPAGETAAFWVLSDRVHRIGTDNHWPHTGKPLAMVKKLYPKYKIRWADRDAGQYHPRMYMGDYFDYVTRPPLLGDDYRACCQLTEHEEILASELKDIARAVTPARATRKAFGSRIRNLLFMACTEVEAQCKAILMANGYSGNPRHMNMGDYRKVSAPLQLAKFKVGIIRFPDYPSTSPFKKWPLPWYQAYNKSKHDAEKHFATATLEHAISAVTAVSILQIAQFGNEALHEHTTPILMLDEKPSWDPRKRSYLPAPSTAVWTPVPYKF